MKRNNYRTVFSIPMWLTYIIVTVLLAIGVLVFALLYNAGGANVLQQ